MLDVFERKPHNRTEEIKEASQVLNENIKNMRKQKGYTQETFAQELNVVRQTVSKWEKGYSVPDAVMLEKIAELFDVSVNELLGGEKEKKEETPDFMKVTEQLSILNNQLAKELSRKRRNRKIALIVLGVVFAAIFLLCTFVLFPSRIIVTQNEEITSESDTDSFTAAEIDSELDKAISDAVMAHNSASFLSGEFETESHLVYETKETGETVKVYLTECYAEYGFCSGFFMDISGGISSAVYTFKKTDGGYEFLKAEYPEEGSHLSSSVKQLFPEKIAEKVLSGLSESELEFLNDAHTTRAQAYLDSIGRTAVICAYSDIEHILLSDLGVDDETDNKLLDMFPEYDYTVGNHEKIEDGKRVVYQTDYDERNGWVTYTKFEYDTCKVIEFTAVDAKSGDIVKNAEKPEKAEYKMGKIAN